jgi:hypothetical protein
MPGQARGVYARVREYLTAPAPEGQMQGVRGGGASARTVNGSHLSSAEKERLLGAFHPYCVPSVDRRS